MDEASTLDFMVGKLSAHREVRRIVLFGSRARGEAKSESDYDLCLIVDEVADIRALYVELMRGIASADWSVDLVLLTERDFHRRLGEGWSAIKAVEREGRGLYAA
jgi:predicted nucleotidyltransferase